MRAKAIEAEEQPSAEVADAPAALPPVSKSRVGKGEELTVNGVFFAVGALILFVALVTGDSEGIVVAFKIMVLYAFIICIISFSD